MKTISLITILFCLVFITLFFMTPSKVNAFILDNATPFSLQSPTSLPESYQDLNGPNMSQGSPISLDTGLKSKFLGIDITILETDKKTVFWHLFQSTHSMVTGHVLPRMLPKCKEGQKTEGAI